MARSAGRLHRDVQVEFHSRVEVALRLKKLGFLQAGGQRLVRPVVAMENVHENLFGRRQITQPALDHARQVRCLTGRDVGQILARHALQHGQRLTILVRGRRLFGVVLALARSSRWSPSQIKMRASIISAWS